MDSLRVVEVEAGVYYEFVHPPCVRQAFFQGGKKISTQYRWNPVMCGNPRIAEAAEACCTFGSTYANRNTLFYDGERLTFEDAGDRCSDISQELCDFYLVHGSKHKNAMHFWTTDDCAVHAKVKGDGMVTVVHDPSDSDNIVSWLSEENENWFKVYWNNGLFPQSQNDCDGCQVLSEGSCLCNILIAKNQVFGTAPTSVAELLDELYIGTLDPSAFNSGMYDPTYDEVSGITTHLRNGVFNSRTIFEFTDDKGRRRLYKNSRETVQLRDTQNGYTGYSFRNTPQFMSFVPTKATRRDAVYETDATLDNYFYHDNTPPYTCEGQQ